jgi:hypothetical protein
MTTNVRVTNLNNKEGGHAVVASILNLHPSTTPPVKVTINPQESHDFTLTAAQSLRCDEDNGINS